MHPVGYQRPPAEGSIELCVCQYCTISSAVPATPAIAVDFELETCRRPFTPSDDECVATRAERRRPWLSYRCNDDLQATSQVERCFGRRLLQRDRCIIACQVDDEAKILASESGSELTCK